MTNYAKGADLERQVQEHMRLCGAALAMRSAGSHGPVDVSGFFPSHSRLIQVTTKGQSVPHRVAELDNLRVSPTVTKEVWVRVRAGWEIVAVDELSYDKVLEALRAAHHPV